jgi:4-hydroxy-tetrahydrodipicolinate reductase
METDPGSALQPMGLAASKEWFKLLAGRSPAPYEINEGDQCAWRQDNQYIGKLFHTWRKLKKYFNGALKGAELMVTIVVVGARGRMGATLVELVQRDEELSLAGVTEREERLGELAFLNCPAASSLEEVLPQAPGAVVVDFSQPEVTIKTVQAARQSSNPVVIGTTGFSQDQQQALRDAAAELPLFWAPNMSVGINVLLELLPKLAEFLGQDYDVDVSEIHHKHKKDAPSGTALKLGQVLAEAKGFSSDSLRACREGMIGERPRSEIGLQTMRGGDVVGEHTVYFFGPGERIDVTHKAYSRETFAQGALRAAKWLSRQSPGRLYAMADVFRG